MRSAQTQRTAIPLLLLLLLATTGCLFGSPVKDGGTDPIEEYLPYTSPDNLVSNFMEAWENQNIDQYRDNILYNNGTAATWAEGSNDFATFTFYFVAGVDQWGDPLPDHQFYEDEWSNAERMFSGNEGRNGTPGVNSIDIALIANGIWSEPNTDLIEGDEWPAGTLERVYSTDMTVMLKGNLPDDPDINGFIVTDRLQFRVIPVRVEDSSDQGYHKEYRIWKWHDLENI